MRKRQFKRERPTLKTAHKFFKEGSFLIDPERHSVSDAERKIELQSIGDELSKIVKREFPRTQILEYAILKSHLIIEYTLVQYIRWFAATSVSASSIRFTFSQKLEIAYLLGFGVHDPILLPTIEVLNKIRNQVAHTFTLDKIALDEVLRINHEDYDEFKPRDDKQRIQCLRWICIHISGRVAGEILTAYSLASLPESDL